MSLTRADVEHAASLARIGLSDDDISTFQTQLSSILDYADTMNELDTNDVLPTAQVVPLVNVVRTDEVRPSLAQEAVIGMAPESHDEFIAVPSVLSGGEEEPA